MADDVKNIAEVYLICDNTADDVKIVADVYLICIIYG